MAPVGIRTELWSDGSGVSGGGPGGWAFVLRALDADTGEVLKEREESGGLESATANRAELTAIIKGLLVLERPARLTIFTDSQYAMSGIADGWVQRWEANGWRTQLGGPVVHQDLWVLLAGGAKLHDLTWKLVKGHARTYRCPKCPWAGDDPRKPTKRVNGRRMCPTCDERVAGEDKHPLNVRADILAGEARRALVPEPVAA